MAHSMFGDREAAHTCYGRAVEFTKGREFPAAVADRAHDEARQLMGLKELTE
jgi:hypothetical protein